MTTLDWPGATQLCAAFFFLGGSVIYLISLLNDDYSLLIISGGLWCAGFSLFGVGCIIARRCATRAANAQHDPANDSTTSELSIALSPV